MIPEAAVEAAAWHEPLEVAFMDGTQDTTICAACGVVRGGWVASGSWPCEQARVQP